MSAPKTHADFAASSSKRWLACPGSIKATQGLSSPDSEPSRQGNAAHALAEYSLEKNIDPMKIRAQLLDKEYQKYVDEEMRKGVRKYVDGVKALAERGELLIEEKFDLSWVAPEVLVPERLCKNGAAPKGKFTMFGTGDAMVIEHYGDVHVTDLKFGKGIQVEAVDNPQLAFYGLGGAQRAQWDFPKAHLRISQPRRDHFPTWTLSRNDLKDWVKIFREGVMRAVVDDPPLVSGDHCRFCPASATCPEVKESVSRQAAIEFADVSSTPAVMAASLLPEQIGQVLDKADMIEGWLSDVKAKAFVMLEQGEEIPGWKLVNKKGRRVWKDPKAVTKKLSAKLRAKMFTEPELISPNQAEKVIGKEMVNKLAVSVSSGKTLAKVTDKRPALGRRVEDDFGDW